MAIRTNPYNNPAIGAGLDNIAQMFAPDSASDVYQRAQATAQAQKADRLNQYWTAMRDPSTPKDVADRLGIAAGLFSPNASYWSVDQNNQRQITENENNNRVTLDKARIDNQGAYEREIGKPINVAQGSTVYLPQKTAAATGLPQMFGGSQSVKAGETVTTPSFTPTNGAPEIPSQTFSGAPDADRTPKFGVIGEDQYGGKIYGYPPKYDPSVPTAQIIRAIQNGALQPPSPSTPTSRIANIVQGRSSADAVAGAAPTPPDAAQSPTPQQPVDPSIHGETFLSTLDPNMQSQVRAIVEGRASYPTGMLLRTPYGQKLASLVTQADPSFDAGNATARVSVRREFAAGGPNSPASTITAGNTAMQHLGRLSDIAEGLGNADSGIPGNNFYNAAKNTLATSAGGGLPVVQFNNVLNKYVEEATKFYRGIGGNEADIKRELESISPNLSPPQLRAAIQAQTDLIASKINALQSRWRQGMGPLVPDFPIVSQESQSALDRINKRAAPPTPTAPAPQPTSVGSVAEGTTAINRATGARLIFRNGQWEPLQ